MKLGIAGKGGTGKTTLVGTMAREFAHRGHRVTAFDVDPQPTLAMTLGIDLETADNAGGVPTDLFDLAVQGGPLTGEQIVERYGLRGPDGIRLIIAHRIEHVEMHCNSSAHVTVRAMLKSLIGEADDVVVVDMEAGLEHFTRGLTLADVDAMMILVEPFHKSILTGRQIALLADELGIKRRFAVANKVRNPDDMPPITEFCQDTGLELIGSIPWDTTLQDAELRAQAPFDYAPDAPGVRAARDLAATILERLQPVARP
ncbi:MAG: AAA family ATPase [Actinobacteria bacterium]|nr:AAA family ATPase [Actinomycetota bacterium]